MGRTLQRSILLLALVLAATAAESTAPAASSALAFRATLTATGHTPRVGEPWYFTVRVTDREGAPIAARVWPVVKSGPRVLDHVGAYIVYGVCGHAYTWQAAHRGKTRIFQVRVAYRGTTIRLNYWVRAR